MMKKQGCTHEAGYCVATGTWKMGLSTGHKTAYSLPYDRYLENGHPIFSNMHDGATASNTTLMDYKRDNPNPRNKKSMMMKD
uniref:Uncharacterized protein n=1 Tax=Panagrolaimus superbus TaxID=310955 RepID=A0A914YZM3_9BILA